MKSKLKFIKNHFSWVIAFVCISLFSFNFWLFYPGYVTVDWANVIPEFQMNNWMPVIYSHLLKIITKIFGYHIYYSLLFNLVPFYLGIYIIILGCWKKFHSQWCWLGLLPVCIGNIFFNNLFMHCSFASPMFIFLLWTIVLYQILVGISLKNIFFAGIAFIFATISRHNALIQTYPIFFIYSLIILQNQNKLLKYTGLCFLFAGLTLAVSIGIPSLLKEGKSYPSTHIFLHQIAGACVPSNDESCFKPEWYEEGRSFDDVKREYNLSPLLADKMTWRTVEKHPFHGGRLNQLTNMWIKSIIRYPYNYLRHTSRFTSEMWHANTLDKIVYLNRKNRCLRETDTDKIINKYPYNEIFYKTPNSKIKIYDVLINLLPQIPTIFYILLNYILFIISGILFYKKRDLLSLYTLSSSTAGIAGSIIFCIFTPAIFPRYIYPVLASSLTSTIGIILHFCSKTPILECNIEKTNFKEMMKNSKKALITISFLIILYSIYAYINAPLKARADVYTLYNDIPYFIVHQNNIPQPALEASWMPNGGNRGVVVQQLGNSMSFTITALEDTDIKIALRGPDERDSNGKRYEKWVKYTSFTINGKEILPANQDVWHDKPFKHILKAKKNNAYKVNLKYRKK